MEVPLLRTPGARILCSGHRGAKGHAPENTFASFERAVELGADVIELDVHLSQDGEVVVIHDHTVDRTTNGAGMVKDLSLSQLKQLDAGAWYDSRYMGQQIPALREVLAWARDRVPLAIEIKNGPIYYPGIADKVIRLLREHEMIKQAMLLSFDHVVLREAKMIAPEVATGILYVGRLIDPLAAAKEVDADSLNPNWAFVTPDLVEMAHAAGLAVSPWAPNDVAVMRTLSEMGCDSIGTDCPELCAQLEP